MTNLILFGVISHEQCWMCANTWLWWISFRNITIYKVFSERDKFKKWQIILNWIQNQICFVDSLFLWDNFPTDATWHTHRLFHSRISRKLMKKTFKQPLIIRFSTLELNKIKYWMEINKLFLFKLLKKFKHSTMQILF